MIYFYSSHTGFGGSTVIISTVVKILNEAGIPALFYGQDPWFRKLSKYNVLGFPTLSERDIFVGHMYFPEKRPNVSRSIAYVHEEVTDFKYYQFVCDNCKSEFTKVISVDFGSFPYVANTKPQSIKEQMSKCECGHMATFKGTTVYDQVVFSSINHEKKSRYYQNTWGPSVVIPNPIDIDFEWNPPKERVAGIIGTISYRKNTLVSIQKAKEYGFQKILLYGPIDKHSEKDIPQYFKETIKPIIDNDRNIKYIEEAISKEEMYNSISEVFDYSVREQACMVLGECKKLGIPFHTDENTLDWYIYSNEEIVEMWKNIFDMNQVNKSYSREEIANIYIHGNGIEIGALHSPLKIHKTASVKYIDRVPVSELRKHYPECSHLKFVDIDIIENSEDLTTIKSSTQDFVIANHLIEHCEDPIRMMENIIRVLKPNGVAYIALPDKRFTFDKNRQITTIDHLIKDHIDGPHLSRKEHFQEWVDFCLSPNDKRTIDDFLNMNYSIHYHVWTMKEMIEFIQFLPSISHFPARIERVFDNTSEVIFIIRKNSEISNASSTKTTSKRHLLYHVYANKKSNEWLMNIQELNKYSHVFNGKRTVVIASDETTVPINEVKSCFNFNVEFVEVKNNPKLRETAHFIQQLSRFQTINDNEYLFFAHTKGTTYKNDPKIESVRNWRDAMYRECLLYPEEIDNILKNYTSAGCFLFDYKCDLTYLNGNKCDAPWHYSGTFWWINLKKLFSNKNWKNIYQHSHGVEFYLGNLFNLEEAYAIAYRNYDPSKTYEFRESKLPNHSISIIVVSESNLFQQELKLQLEENDEIILTNSNNINSAIRSAKGSHLYITNDYDDILSGSIRKIHFATLKNPYKIHIFKMLDQSNVIWSRQEIESPDIKKSMVVLPNIKEWIGSFSGSGNNFFRDCVLLHPRNTRGVVWNDDIIAICNSNPLVTSYKSQTETVKPKIENEIAQILPIETASSKVNKIRQRVALKRALREMNRRVK